MTSPLSADEVLRLGELARKATPGPWAVCTEPLNDVWYKDVTIFRKEWGTRLADVSILESLYKENAAFIAAANPAAILSILSEMESLRAQVAVLVGALRDYVYETTHLSPERADGSHDCRISQFCLRQARGLLKDLPAAASTLLREVETLRKTLASGYADVTVYHTKLQEMYALHNAALSRAEAAEARVTELESALTGLRRSLSEAANTGDGAYRP